MQHRWASLRAGFTIVELLIVVVIIAILAAITMVAYNGITRQANTSTMHSALKSAQKAMEHAKVTADEYPSTLPSSIQTGANTTLTLVYSGNHPVYSGGLTPVQNGTLFADICQDMIASGLGRGIDTGGVTRDYITGCGNWNNNSTQVTGWNSVVWNTPVTEAHLRTYADNYTVGAGIHKTAQEAVYKNFYRTLIARVNAQGGGFPINSFWDYWANGGNGGVMPQALPDNPSTESFYCIEVSSAQQAGVVWRITQEGIIQEARCLQ